MAIVITFFITKHPHKKTMAHYHRLLFLKHREKGYDIVIVAFFESKEPQKNSKRRREGVYFQAPTSTIGMKLSTFLSSSCLTFPLS
jgi:hypothetical protein